MSEVRVGRLAKGNQTMGDVSTRKFIPRFLVATSSAFILVYLCSVSLSPGFWGGLEYLWAPAVGVLIFSIPCGAISAAVVKTSDLRLALTAQALTIASLAAWAAWNR
jgi:hypothetical protein